MELLPPPSLMRPIVTGDSVAGWGLPSALLAPAVPDNVDTAVTVRTAEARRPLVATLRVMLLDRLIASDLSTVPPWGAGGDTSRALRSQQAPRGLRPKRVYRLVILVVNITQQFQNLLAGRSTWPVGSTSIVID